MTQVIFFFPYVLKQFSGPLYALLTLTSIFLITLSAFLKREISINTPWVYSRDFQVFSVLYMLYSFVVILATIIQINDPRGQSLSPIIYPNFFLIFAGLMFVSLENEYIFKLDKIFNKLTLLFASLAILGTVLIALKVLPPLGTVYMESMSKIAGTGERDFYGLTLGWMNLRIGSINFPRLQSYASEAGNFAMPVAIAIFHFMYRRKLKWVYLLLIAFILTFSLGNWLCIIFVLSLRIFRGKLFQVRYVNFLLGLFTFIVFISVIASLPKEIFNFFEWYLSTKFGDGGDTTSLGIRYTGLSYMFNEMNKDDVIVLGYGYNAKSFLATTLANGWTDPFLKGGVIGTILCYTAYFMLIFKAIKFIIISESPLLLYAGSSLLYITLIATQRGFMDASLWAWWIVILFLRSPYLCSELTKSSTFK